MLTKKPEVGQIGVLTKNVGKRFAGRLVRIVAISPAYYTVEFLHSPGTGAAFRRNVFNSELHMLRDEKEVFIYMLKEPKDDL